jgi:uncharacterized protein YfaS (alpha-2-macroglobulin family)
MGTSAPDGGQQSMNETPGTSLESRPLKTGAAFTLVIAAPRMHKLAWDKANYAPGDACELSLTGKNLGKGPLELVIESEQNGVWMEVDKVQAKVDDGQATAAANWKFPMSA